MPTLLDELCSWASTLELEDVPDRVVALARSQILSHLGSVRIGMGHPVGQRLQRAFGGPLQGSPERSAGAMAGLSCFLHQDDFAFSGHVSSSVVPVAASYAHATGMDGRDLLLAVIAANECAARITAAATLGPLRGQTAAHAHLAGAIAARAKCAGAPSSVWVDAFGIGFTIPMLPLLHGFLSSDAKALAAATPVRAGLDAYSAAAVGLHGPADILEHPKGFLAKFADVPLPEVITSGLGTRWHTETLAFKLRPGAPTLDAAVDCALRLGDRVDAGDISEIVVTTSLYSMLIEQASAPYLDGPHTPVSALAFNTPYCVATAILTGDLTAADFAAPAVNDFRRWALAARVRVEHDDEMTRDSLRAPIPLGEALRYAGDRAAPWLTEVGTHWLADLVGPLSAPCESFQNSARIAPARIMVALRDGSIVTEEQVTPVGSPGSVSRGRHADQVRRKFLATGGAAAVADIAQALDGATSDDVRQMLDWAIESPIELARTA